MNLSDVGKIALVGGVVWLVSKQIFGAETDRRSAETTQMATSTGYQPPAYPEMVIESLTIRPEVNQYLNTEYGSAPSPSVSNFVAMIRGVPV
jgi:hypothetical protein